MTIIKASREFNKVEVYKMTQDGLSYRWDSRCCCTVKPDKHRYSGDGSSRD